MSYFLLLINAYLRPRKRELQVALYSHSVRFNLTNFISPSSNMFHGTLSPLNPHLYISVIITMLLYKVLMMNYCSLSTYLSSWGI